MPNPSLAALYKPHTFKIIESKRKDKECYLDFEVKAKKHVPSPCLYQPDHDKTEMIMK